MLGPLLFIVYLNDLTNCIQNCKYMLYADDIVIYKDIDLDTNPDDIQCVQQDVTKIIDGVRSMS